MRVSQSILRTLVVLFVLSALAVWWHFGKCSPPPIPESADIASIVVVHKDKDLVQISDGKLIHAFIEEMRSLRCRGYRRKPSLDHFVLKDKAGRVLFRVAHTGRAIVLKDAAGEEYEMARRPVPLLGRLYSCGYSKLIISWLEAMTEESKWSPDEKQSVHWNIDTLNSIMPGAHMALPQTPEDLSRELSRLPILSVDNLDSFADYYETRY